MVWLLLFVCECALAEESGAKEAPVSWTARVEFSEAHEIEDSTYDTLAAGRYLRLNASMEWTRSSAAGPSLVGVFREGSLAFEDLPISDPRMPRLAVKGEVPVDGIKVTVDTGKKGVRVKLSTPELQRALAGWRRAAKGWRITSKQYPAIEAKMTAFLKEMLEIAVSISVADADQTLENMVISRALYSDEGKETGAVSFQADILKADMSPDRLSLRVPLKIERTNKAGVRPNMRHQATLVLCSGKEGSPDQLIQLEGSIKYDEYHDLAWARRGEHSEFLHQPLLRYQLKMAVTPPVALEPKFRPEAHRLAPSPAMEGYLREKDPKVYKEVKTKALSAEGIAALLEDYAQMEEKGRYSQKVRAAVHFILAKRLGTAAFNEKSAEARVALERLIAEETRFPLFVLGLNAVAWRAARVSDAERLTLFKKAARRSDARLARWGGMYLALVPWEGATAALVELLKELEADPKGSPALRGSLSLDLYRLLGPDAVGKWQEYLDEIKKTGAELKPYSHTTVVEPRRSGKTVVGPGSVIEKYMGDCQSVVFVIDSSTSMGEPMDKALRTAWRKPGSELPDGVLRIYDWAERECAAAIKALTESQLFTVMTFNHDNWVWSEALKPGEAEKKQLGIDFIRELKLERGSNLATVLPALYRQDELDVVIIISDGGLYGPEDPEVAFWAWNYLRGTRVITYGFSPARPEDPGLMERLSRAHFGWYHEVKGPTPKDEAEKERQKKK